MFKKTSHNQENKSDERSAIIAALTEEVLRLLDFAGTVTVQEVPREDDKVDLICDISVTDDSRFLIGQHGANLAALQSLLMTIVTKKRGVFTPFTVDVNGYRAQKAQRIKEMAENSAQQALLEKRPIPLPVMNAYDRRIVHMTLVDNDRVVTESVGERDQRHVIVKPQNVLED